MQDDSILFFHYREILSRKIDDLIIGGCEHFITGMADGNDIDFAELVLEKREEKGGTWNTLKYAVSKGKIVKYIMLADIKNQY